MLYVKSPITCALLSRSLKLPRLVGSCFSFLFLSWKAKDREKGRDVAVMRGDAALPRK